MTEQVNETPATSSEIKELKSEIEELKKASLLDKTQELQNLKKKNLESKFLNQKPFFIQIF